MEALLLGWLSISVQSTDIDIYVPANHDGVKNEGSMLTRASDRAAPADKSEGVEVWKGKTELKLANKKF